MSQSMSSLPSDGAIGICDLPSQVYDSRPSDGVQACHLPSEICDDNVEVIDIGALRQDPSGGMASEISNAHRHSKEKITAAFSDMISHAETLKDDIRLVLAKPLEMTTYDRYYEKGGWQKLAKHPIFENVTLGVIAFNAVWMSVDTDWNKAETLPDADTLFQVMEHLFCTYFSMELFVRFMAFKHKCDGRKDGWFVFDSMLVALMVSETWILLIVAHLANVEAKFPFGNASVLRLLRLLRLSRLLRMLRSLPELMILCKGMAKALESVGYVMVLLVIVAYVFGIACTQLAVDTEMSQLYFQNVAMSMYSLMIYACFMDNLADFTNAIRVESVGTLTAVFFFMYFASLVVLNLLVGVLCEVISGVAIEEAEEARKQDLYDRMMVVAHTLDGDMGDSDHRISANEFIGIFHDVDALRALEKAGIDPEDVVDVSTVMFFQDNGQEIDLSFEEFCDQVFELRNDNNATLRDIKYLWSHVMPKLDTMLRNVDIIRGRIERLEEKSLACLHYVKLLSELPASHKRSIY